MAYSEQRYVGQSVVGRKADLFAPQRALWTERSNPKNVRLNAFAWSPSLRLYAAVGEADGTDAYIVTSPDGITWTERTNPKNFSLGSVAWSPTLALFAAVGFPDGTDAYLVTSPDGVTWTERANPVGEGRALDTVVWSPELALFCATGSSLNPNPTYIITSPDGVTWTRSSLAGLPAIEMVALAWSPALSLFATGGSNGTILTSPDGVTWTQRAAVSNSAFQACVWSGVNFVMVGNIAGTPDDAMIYTSPDGITWTERSSPVNTVNLHAVMQLPSGQLYAFGDGVSVTGGYEPYMIRSRDDGVTWTRITGELPVKDTAAKASIGGGTHGLAICAYAPELRRLVVVGANDGTDAYLATTDHLR